MLYLLLCFPALFGEESPQRGCQQQPRCCVRWRASCSGTGAASPFAYWDAGPLAGAIGMGLCDLWLCGQSSWGDRLGCAGPFCCRASVCTRGWWSPAPLCPWHSCVRRTPCQGWGPACPIFRRHHKYLTCSELAVLLEVTVGFLLFFFFFLLVFWQNPSNKQ